jgi:hypothetical protein
MILPRPLKCYCKIIEEACRVKHSLKKKWQENKMEGGKVFIKPLGGGEIFRGSAENPLRVLFMFSYGQMI